MSLVIDYFAPHDRAFMDCVAAAGVTGIARYLTASPADPRQLTADEVAAAHAAGLAVHFYFEMNPTYPAYFTFVRGAEDCRQATARLRELGAPAGSVVYFTVDTNIDPPLVVEYFNGVASEVTPQLVAGVYGYERMVEFARANFPLIGQHLAQTYGWPRRPLDLWQYEQRAMCGVAVDLSECGVAGWRREEPMADLPALIGQGPDLILKVGEVGELRAIFHWPDGRERTLTRKVWSHKPGRTPYPIYPRVDPDADETEFLDAEPAWFMVTVETP